MKKLIIVVCGGCLAFSTIGASTQSHETLFANFENCSVRWATGDDHNTPSAIAIATAAPHACEYHWQALFEWYQENGHSELEAMYRISLDTELVVGRALFELISD